jgi:hypothetical protein
MVYPNKINVQTVEHFDCNNNSLGFLNEYESCELRCQIAEQKVDGYYLIFKNEKIEILPNGKIINWINGLYDTNEILLSRLFRAQRSS